MNVLYVILLTIYVLANVQACVVGKRFMMSLRCVLRSRLIWSSISCRNLVLSKTLCAEANDQLSTNDERKSSIKYLFPHFISCYMYLRTLKWPGQIFHKTLHFWMCVKPEQLNWFEGMFCIPKQNCFQASTALQPLFSS